MQQIFGQKCRTLRKVKGIKQETIADQLGVSVQAVSKWECGLCYPDVELLPVIADLFGVSVDYLLRETAQPPCTAQLPDDDTLRVVQFKGNKMLDNQPLQQDMPIPLRLDAFENLPADTVLQVEIHGNAAIDGDVTGDIEAGGNVACDDVGGDVEAGGDVACDDVGGDVEAGGDVACGGVGGDVDAGGDVACGGVGGNVAAGSDVTCGSVSGNVDASGDVDCDDVNGNVDAGGDVHCASIEGDVSAGNDVICSESE